MAHVSNELINKVAPYVEDYKYAAVSVLQKQNNVIAKLINEYSYDRVRSALTQAFERQYHQSKHDWSRRMFYEKLTPQIKRQIINKYLETLSVQETTKFANSKFTNLVKLHKFSPKSASHDLWGITDLIKAENHISNIHTYLKDNLDIMMKSLLKYAKVHQPVQTIHTFRDYAISEDLLNDIAYHRLTSFTNSYSYCLDQVVAYYMMHSLNDTIHRFSLLKLSSKLIRNLFLKKYKMTKSALLLKSFKRYIRCTYASKVKMFYINWIFSDTNELPLNHIHTNKYEFICRHCGQIFVTTISKMFDSHHLYYERCPYCSSSKYSFGERLVNAYLTAANIKFISQYSKRINGKLHKFDFYLPDQKMIIEYQGTQHFEQVDYFYQHDKRRSLARQKKLDYIKRQYAADNNLRFVAIDGRCHHYDTLDKVTKLLNLVFTLSLSNTDVRKSYYYRTKFGDFYYHDTNIVEYAVEHGIEKAMHKFNLSKYRVNKLCRVLSV